MESETARRISPEQELSILKLVLRLRSLGNERASDRLRREVRQVLLSAPDDETAGRKVEVCIRDAARQLSKLDGTDEVERERKRQRREARRARREEDAARAARYVQLEAESGDDEEESATGEEGDFDEEAQ